tara:strand:+ start:3068 stop:3232 length:165 start_codon:yes stop_codon:yes gene_type:complete
MAKKKLCCKKDELNALNEAVKLLELKLNHNSKEEVELLERLKHLKQKLIKKENK